MEVGKLQFFSLSDCGKRRTNNEDFAIAEAFKDYIILILADGMGGHNGGEVASGCGAKTALSCIKSKLKGTSTPQEILDILSKAVKRANLEILAEAQAQASLEGMGTTMDVCVIKGKNAYIAHVGDSRVYKVGADEKITQITRDHSLVEFMLESGAITPEEAQHHPQKNVITRALGTNSSIEVDTFTTDISEGDKLLMCSDGLTNMVEETRISKIVASQESLEKIAHTLVSEANTKGGVDNITVIVAGC